MDYTENKIYPSVHDYAQCDVSGPVVPRFCKHNGNLNPSSQIDALVQEIGGITVASLDSLVWNRNESWWRFLRM